MNTTIALSPIVRSNGVMGQFSLGTVAHYSGVCDATGERWESSSEVAFVGSAYADPEIGPGYVIMVTKEGQYPVSEPSRYGFMLDEQWVRRFFSVA